MSQTQTPQQTTLTAFRGVADGHPKLHRPTVREYAATSDIPYEIPTAGCIGIARAKHRTYYWLTHDYWGYTCPDCDRPHGRVNGFDVHHIDENPRNGDPSNLIAICRRCHAQRHGGSRSLAALDVLEWKAQFEEVLLDD